MIGVDTNVLIRMLANDDVRQVEAVRAFLSERGGRDPAYVSAVVLAETLWVLQSRLRYPVEAIISALLKLLASDDLSFQYADRLNALLDQSHPPRADLADYLISWSAESAGCSHTVTFDRRAAKAVPSMELLS